MSSEDFNILYNDLIIGPAKVRSLYTRNQDLQLKEDQWQIKLENLREAGVDASSLMQDEDLKNIRRERDKLLKEMGDQLNRSRLSKEEKVQRYNRLSPNEKIELNQMLRSSLDSIPMEIREKASNDIRQMLSEIKS